MKYFCAITALVAALTVSQLARADGNKAAAKAKPNTPAQTSPNVQVETLQFGRVIEVGPDGKIEVKELNGNLPKEVLEKLPKEVRDLMEKHADKKPAPGQAPAIQGALSGKLKIVVEKDGKRQEFGGDLSDLLGISGGTGQVSGAAGGMFLLKDGEKMPEEARKALDAVVQAMKAQPLAVRPRAGRDEINAKLDKILERLERLEGEVKALKPKTGK